MARDKYVLQNKIKTLLTYIDEARIYVQDNVPEEIEKGLFEFAPKFLKEIMSCEFIEKDIDSRDIISNEISKMHGSENLKSLALALQKENLMLRHNIKVDALFNQYKENFDEVDYKKLYQICDNQVFAKGVISPDDLQFLVEHSLNDKSELKVANLVDIEAIEAQQKKERLASLGGIKLKSKK